MSPYQRRLDSKLCKAIMSARTQEEFNILRCEVKNTHAMGLIPTICRDNLLLNIRLRRETYATAK